jgi:hypothetical protein
MLLHKLQKLLRTGGIFQPYCQMAWIHAALSFGMQPLCGCCAVCATWALVVL